MKEEARPAGVSAWRRVGAGIGKVWRGAGRAAARAVTGPVRWLARRRWAAVAVVLVAAAAVSWAFSPWGALSRGVGWQPLILQRVGGDEPPPATVPLAVPGGGAENRVAGDTEAAPPPAAGLAGTADGPVQADGRAADVKEEAALQAGGALRAAAASEVRGETGPREQAAAATPAAAREPAAGLSHPLVLASPAADAVVVRGRGWYRHPVYRDWRFHPGVELEAAPGSSVAAALGGVVVEAGPDERWGLTVRVQHGNGWQTVYGYLQAIVVQEGQEVAAGGAVGTAGYSPWGDPRLFFAVWKDGISVDPLPLLSR